MWNIKTGMSEAQVLNSLRKPSHREVADNYIFLFYYDEKNFQKIRIVKLKKGTDGIYYVTQLLSRSAT